MYQLPDDVLIEIAINLSINNVNRLCITNSSYNKLLINNNLFLYKLYLKSYGNPYPARIEYINLFKHNVNWKMLHMKKMNEHKLNDIVIYLDKHKYSDEILDYIHNTVYDNTKFSSKSTTLLDSIYRHFMNYKSGDVRINKKISDILCLI